MEDLLEVWRKEYQRLEELKQTEIRHLQSVKINARALQLKYCIKALKKQLSMHDVAEQSEQLKNAEQEGYKKGWEEGAEYGYSAACGGR